jgi:hypothetical protein
MSCYLISAKFSAELGNFAKFLLKFLPLGKILPNAKKGRGPVHPPWDASADPNYTDNISLLAESFSEA